MLPQMMPLPWIFIFFLCFFCFYSLYSYFCLFFVGNYSSFTKAKSSSMTFFW